MDIGGSTTMGTTRHHKVTGMGRCYDGHGFVFVHLLLRIHTSYCNCWRSTWTPIHHHRNFPKPRRKLLTSQFTYLSLLTSQYVQLSEIFYILTTTFLKISLGLFFLRLLTKPWQTRLFQVLLVVSAAYGIFYFFATCFVCGNPAKLGENLANNRAKNCAPIWFVLSTGYIYGVVNVLSDWTFTFIPICVLLDSKMDRREKISVGLIMSFAAVGSISSIMRMVYLRGLLFGRGVSSEF